MNKRLEQMMTGQEGSSVLPFMWPDEAHPEAIEPEIEAIYGCGLRCCFCQNRGIFGSCTLFFRKQ